MDYDTAGGWDGSNYHWNVPRTGVYFINFGVSIRYVSTSNFIIAALWLNTGSGFAAKAKGNFSTEGSGSPSQGQVILDLDAGDELELRFYQNGGASGKDLIGDDVAAGLTYLQITEVL